MVDPLPEEKQERPNVVWRVNKQNNGGGAVACFRVITCTRWIHGSGRVGIPRVGGRHLAIEDSKERLETVGLARTRGGWHHFR